MKYIIVTGDRYAAWDRWGRAINRALDQHAGFEAFSLVHGDARGIDTIAASVARESGYCFAVVPFRADWRTYGKAAGPRRNAEMLTYVKAQARDGDTAEVLAFHDDLENSKGTRDMVNRAYRAGMTVTVYGSDGEVRPWAGR